MVPPRNQTRRKSSAFLGPRSRKRVTVTNQDPKKLMPPPRFPGMEPPRWLAFKAKARALGYIVNEHEGRITDTHRLTKDRNGQIRASADADISLRELKNVVAVIDDDPDPANDWILARKTWPAKFSLCSLCGRIDEGSFGERGKWRFLAHLSFHRHANAGARLVAGDCAMPDAIPRAEKVMIMNRANMALVRWKANERAKRRKKLEEDMKARREREGFVAQLGLFGDADYLDDLLDDEIFDDILAWESGEDEEELHDNAKADSSIDSGCEDDQTTEAKKLEIVVKEEPLECVDTETETTEPKPDPVLIKKEDKVKGSKSVFRVGVSSVLKAPTIVDVQGEKGKSLKRKRNDCGRAKNVKRNSNVKDAKRTPKESTRNEQERYHEQKVVGKVSDETEHNSPNPSTRVLRTPFPISHPLKRRKTSGMSLEVGKSVFV